VRRRPGAARSLALGCAKRVAAALSYTPAPLYPARRPPIRESRIMPSTRHPHPAPRPCARLRMRAGKGDARRDLRDLSRTVARVGDDSDVWARRAAGKARVVGRRLSAAGRTRLTFAIGYANLLPPRGILVLDRPLPLGQPHMRGVGIIMRPLGVARLDVADLPQRVADRGVRARRREARPVAAFAERVAQLMRGHRHAAAQLAPVLGILQVEVAVADPLRHRIDAVGDRHVPVHDEIVAAEVLRERGRRRSRQRGAERQDTKREACHREPPWLPGPAWGLEA